MWYSPHAHGQRPVMPVLVLSFVMEHEPLLILETHRSMHLGTHPVSWLSYKFKYVRSVSLPSAAGMVPVSSLPSKFKPVRPPPLSVASSALSSCSSWPSMEVDEMARSRVLLPASIMMGATLALVADLVARLPGSQATLPLNAVTALIGAPVVTWIILRRRDLRQAFAS